MIISIPHPKVWFKHCRAFFAGMGSPCGMAGTLPPPRPSMPPCVPPPPPPPRSHGPDTSFYAPLQNPEWMDGTETYEHGDFDHLDTYPEIPDDDPDHGDVVHSDWFSDHSDSNIPEPPEGPPNIKVRQ